MAVVLGIVLLVAALYVLGTWGGEPDEQEAGRPAATPAGAAAGDKKKKKKHKKAAKKATVKLQIQPTGPVSVCLENAAGKPLIENVTLQAGQDSETFKSKSFRVSFGTGAAVMRVDGKRYDVSDEAPIGYEVRAGGKPHALSEAERPTCSG